MMCAQSFPGITFNSVSALSQLQPVQISVNQQKKAIQLSGLQTDVFENHLQKAKPATQLLHFGSGWPSPQPWNVARAKQMKKTTDPYESAFFRSDNSFFSSLPLIIKLQKDMGEPLDIVIDGDHRGKDAASLISLLHAETGESYAELAKKFVITRRDIHENALEKGLRINHIDIHAFAVLRELDENKFNPIIKKLEQARQDSSFRKGLGKCQQVDITDPTLPLPTATRNVRFAMQILHCVSPKQRLDYIRMLSKAQAPGSLLVLGANEVVSPSLVMTSQGELVKHAKEPEATIDKMVEMWTMFQMHGELKKLGYEARNLVSENDTGFRFNGLNFNDFAYVYEKVRDVPIPERDPKVETLIYSQALKDHPEFAIRLSQQGFDVNARHPKDKQTLLCLAVQKRLLNVAKALVDAGAKSTVSNGKNVKPINMLDAKAQKQNAELFQLLNNAS